jgi:hypothetical protein
LKKLVTTVGPTEEVVLAAIVKVLLGPVSKGVVRLRGAVQERVEARLSVQMPRYAVEPAVVEHLKALILQSALAPPATLEEIPNLAEWAQIDLVATAASVLCCNPKLVLQVLFGMLQPRPARVRKRIQSCVHLVNAVANKMPTI